MARHAPQSRRSDRDASADDPEIVIEAESGLEVRVAETVRSVEQSRWNDVVERSDLGTVFHRYEWIDAIETALDQPARHFVVEKDTNPIGVFPNFVVDVPKTPFSRLTSIYPGFGGPLLTTDVSESLDLVLEAAADHCTGRTIVHEIRACNPNFLRYDDYLRSRGYETGQTGGRFQINLAKGYDAVRDEMASSKRRAIRRGRETDHEIVEEELTSEAIERFHEPYARHMESVGGTVFPTAFFEKLAAMEDRVLLVTLRVEGEYAGGFVELLDEERSTVHGFIAGVPSEYFEYHASELLYDYVFRWAIEEGYDRYDFGGSGGDFRDGAFSFKEEFGGDLVPNVYWERGASPLWRVVDAGRSLYWQYGD